MKKLLALCLSACMAFTMASCGKTEEASAATSYETTGTVVSYEDNNLVITTDSDTELTFDISDASIKYYGDEDTIKEDDTAIVSYEGELDGDNTADCQVSSVAITAGELKTVEGTIYSIGDDEGTITVKNADGDYLTFDVTKAERHYKNGIKQGNEIVVKYTGSIDGDDTSKAHAHVVIDEDENKVKQEETTTVTACNDTVYTTAAVNVRTGSSSATKSVTVVKKGTKFTRTGKLSNGWSRVTYKKKDCYIASQYLTTKDPSKSAKATESTKATETTKAKETTKATGATKSTTKATTEATTKATTEATTKATTESETTEATETDESTEAPTKNEIEGEVVSFTTDEITIKIDSNEELTFKTDVATIDIPSGKLVGSKVEVEYYGEINGTDTSGATDIVISVLAE